MSYIASTQLLINTFDGWKMKANEATRDYLDIPCTINYRIAGMFGEGKFGKFGECHVHVTKRWDCHSTPIRQTFSRQIIQQINFAKHSRYTVYSYVCRYHIHWTAGTYTVKTTFELYVARRFTKQANNSIIPQFSLNHNSLPYHRTPRALRRIP